VTSSMAAPTRSEATDTIPTTKPDKKQASQKSPENGEQLTKSSTLGEAGDMIIGAGRGCRH